MVAIVVGINLIPAIIESIAQVEETNPEATSGALRGLLNILPYVFVAVVILGAVSWMGFQEGDSSNTREVTIKTYRNKRSLVSRLKKASNDLSDYMNNLDTILGIRTLVANTQHGLMLTKNNELLIEKDTEQGGVWDWYLVDKAEDQLMFKVVGLNREDASKNVVFVLGTNNNQPYLINVPNEHVESTKKEWVALVKE